MYPGWLCLRFGEGARPLTQQRARLSRLTTRNRTLSQVIHFAEQRAAPYSQKGSREKRYTVDNNTGGTHNMLVAIVESGLDIHVCHLGTMG